MKSTHSIEFHIGQAPTSAKLKHYDLDSDQVSRHFKDPSENFARNWVSTQVRQMSVIFTVIQWLKLDDPRLVTLCEAALNEKEIHLRLRRDGARIPQGLSIKVNGENPPDVTNLTVIVAQCVELKPDPDNFGQATGLSFSKSSINQIQQDLSDADLLGLVNLSIPQEQTCLLRLTVGIPKFQTLYETVKTNT